MTVGKLKTEFKTFLTVRAVLPPPPQKKPKNTLPAWLLETPALENLKESCARDVFSVVPLNSRAGPF